MRCWSLTGSAISWRRSPRSRKETSASRASLRCFGGCGAMRSRCPRTWCVSTLMRNRSRWALGRRRARRTPISCSRLPSIGCSRSFANARRRLRGAGEPYDALLDEHEPGMSRSRLDPVLDEVRNALVPLVRAADPCLRPIARGRIDLPRPANGTYAGNCLTAMGFAFERGRLDRSTHPFTLFAGANDVRLTIRVDESDLSTAVLAALHEGGHGLYDQGFAPNDRDTLLAEAPSMGLQESQARLWENHVGRSRAFWDHVFPSLQRLFPDAVRRARCRRASTGASMWFGPG